MIDTANQNQLNTILQKLGVNKSEEEKQANSDQLGQEDFLKLMTTQLQNQDPFAPMLWCQGMLPVRIAMARYME